MLNPQTILITGATGSIGNALAVAYAAPGITLVLQGRNALRLAELTQQCKSQGAEVFSKQLDVRDISALSDWLTELSQTLVVDLAIVNAGVNINIGRDQQGETWPEAQALIETNLLAAMASVNALLPAMRQRKNGQIALMSSLAAYFGLPVTPSYCASKAGIKAYGEALRGWLRPEGIKVNVIMPGYVSSAMCNAMPGPKPFLWPASKAAAYIKRRLAVNQARISFPFPLNLGTWLLSVMRPDISLWLLRLLGYGG